MLEYFLCTSITKKCDIYILWKLTMLEQQNGIVLANTHVPIYESKSTLFSHFVF